MAQRNLRKVGSVLVILVVAVAAGTVITHSLRTTNKLPHRVAYCATYTFDHVTFLRNVDNSEKQATTLASGFSNSTDPLEIAKHTYFEDKIRSLRSLGSLVELHVRMNGPSYGCADKAERLLVHQLNYPTLRSMNRAEELEFLWKKIQEHTRHPPWWAATIQGIGGPIVAALVALFGIYIASRRERQKDDRRIVEVNETPDSTDRDTKE